MEILAYFASALIGISLGLIGGGGSILTVPVLVYLFAIDPVLSTSYSLFIVGSTSLVGAINNYHKGLVSIKTALLFGLSSITTVFLIRKFVIPAIPEKLFSISDFTLKKGIVTMVLFAFLMIAAAVAMIKNGKIEKEATPVIKKLNIIKLLALGVAIGIATGMLGAGGGFLLIPTLVLLIGLPMKEAVGTSLLIIALNSLIGFTGDIGHFTIDWKFLLIVTAIAIVGIFIGGLLNKKINGNKLKKGFGWFVLIMGTYIIVKEVFIK
ncbi:sulfite exporter TauE/SafE family protein [Mucilaginibacter segetis]|uniref:Probable membrane transporter protein n=1 Tax=Mucilaginibacter segetis TaxID=2793071 RepID=A0A934PW21_9SPHI|nr:sulfite exporter TauE/SafE family protein [Mucilaginibacter segetis]MBK0380180.1 sulfite exporter TauE/SafE family protein [Mucilaginibacter segetis]